jgi:putative SOS response-associated peptidase YedK
MTVCGRIALYTPPHRLARLLEATLAAGVEAEFAPSWNLAPTRTLFGASIARDGRRILDAYRWGLVPNWAKDPTSGAKTFNARVETALERPSFATSFERRRLLLPVDGFFEWDRRGGGKVPHYFVRTDGEPLVLAGLYDRWRDRAVGGPWLATCTVLTTSPGEDIDGIHDRMPVVLEADAFDEWLDPGTDASAARAMCVPATAGTLVHHPVDVRVGNVANDWPELIAAV